MVVSIVYTLLIILGHKKTPPTSIVFTMVAQKLEHRVKGFTKQIADRKRSGSGGCIWYALL